MDITLEDIEVASGGELTIVDFWRPTCAPCRIMLKELPRIQQETGAKDVKVNIDSIQESELGKVLTHYKIETVPTLIVFRDGVEELRVIGLVKTRDIIKAIVEIKNSTEVEEEEEDDILDSVIPFTYVPF